MKGSRTIPTFCGMCGPSAGCGIYAHVRDGKFIRIEGMKECPLNRGRNCPKAHAAPEWVYSPDRLRYPLRRVGAKGEGRFEKIAWDEAVAMIAEKLMEQKEKFGPESLAILSPARRSYSEYLYRFLMAHGSPNYCHSGICAMQNAFSFAYTLGVPWPIAEYQNSDLIIIWGKQPVYSGASKGATRLLVEARERSSPLSPPWSRTQPWQIFGSPYVQGPMQPSLWPCSMSSSTRAFSMPTSSPVGVTVSMN
jgi:anaerobic selenocysteine-containing dehydrogenase